MNLIDLDQRVIVPVVDDTRGGMRYEVEMSVEELQKKALEDFEPEIVEAVPMWWITEKYLDVLNKDKELSKAVWLVRKAWIEEQGRKEWVMRNL